MLKDDTTVLMRLHYLLHAKYTALPILNVSIGNVIIDEVSMNKTKTNSLNIQDLPVRMPCLIAYLLLEILQKWKNVLKKLLVLLQSRS